MPAPHARTKRRARRRAELSQHFLRRGALAARLVELTSVSRNDVVVEIGPGTGALTRILAGRCQRLIAIELDPRLHAGLRTELGGQVDVVAADFLQWELPPQPYKIVGNVPYARTTQIVRRLTTAAHPPEDAWIVVQREAAWRFAGAPFAPETRWSLQLKPRWQVEILCHLRRTDFDPPPSVESALLWLARRPRPLIMREQMGSWRQFTTRALAGGSELRRALRPWLSSRQIARLARELRLDLEAPPSGARFDQWLAIFRFLAQQRQRDQASGP